MGFGIRREKSHYLQFNSGSTQVTAAATAYAPVGGSSVFSATENIRQTIATRPMLVSNLVLVTATAQSGTGSVVYTLRKNGVNTAITITIAAGAAAGTFTDSTNSVQFAANDLISLKAVNNASANSSQLIAWSIKTK
jgi:hypothetical protein